MKIEQRVLGGRTSSILTWGISYTFSKAFEANHRLNNWNANEPLIYELDNTDKPHTFAFHGVYDLPFGNGRWLLTGPVSTAIVGNWRFMTTMVVINVILIIPIALRYLKPQWFKKIGVE